MVSKIRYLAFMLLLMMLFLGVVYSQKADLYGSERPPLFINDLGGAVLNPTIDSSAGGSIKSDLPIVYGEGESRPNLFIGGILQKSPDPTQNDQAYRAFADQNQAIYVPAYYSNNLVTDCQEVDNAAKLIPTDQNGLLSYALNKMGYDTIIGYSGGTATAVTALYKLGVKCDTLILISPMKGTLSDPDYENEIKAILTSGAVNHIEVIWSPEDIPSKPIPAFYEAQISSSWDSKNRITVHEEPLTQDKNNGLQAHNLNSAACATYNFPNRSYPCQCIGYFSY